MKIVNHVLINLLFLDLIVKKITKKTIMEK